MNLLDFKYKRILLGPLAQLVEHLPFKEGVDGSSPSGLTKKFNFNLKKLRINWSLLITVKY